MPSASRTKTTFWSSGWPPAVVPATLTSFWPFWLLNRMRGLPLIE